MTQNHFLQLFIVESPLDQVSICILKTVDRPLSVTEHFCNRVMLRLPGWFVALSEKFWLSCKQYTIANSELHTSFFHSSSRTIRTFVHVVVDFWGIEHSYLVGGVFSIDQLAVRSAVVRCYHVVKLSDPVECSLVEH